MNRLQILKLLFGLALLLTIFLLQLSFFDIPLSSHLLITLALFCIFFPVLAHLLHFTGCVILFLSH